MSRGSLTAIVSYTIAILVVIVGFFLLDIEQIALNFWAFGFLLLSLVVSLLVTLALVTPKGNRDRIYYSTGLVSAIWLYELVVIISMFFTGWFAEHLFRFVFLQIAINAVFFIVAVVIVNVSAQVHDNKIKTYDDIQNGEHNRPKRGGI
ncbi:hypothetical protein Ami103574_10310 [Aminipila butyrica]|uniref:Uncharacterized protein n=1 Tax=Aminipila butyrica TaxID=433296 RepID=A0A858BXQ6_9FIRM|nr:hypothetical protein [Aminipila butyrica]QIB69690.1 hypothetical protein Ami103574_10310 [Aminipila butyrica]